MRRTTRSTLWLFSLFVLVLPARGQGFNRSPIEQALYLSEPVQGMARAWQAVGSGEANPSVIGQFFPTVLDELGVRASEVTPLDDDPTFILAYQTFFTRADAAVGRFLKAMEDPANHTGEAFGTRMQELVDAMQPVFEQLQQADQAFRLAHQSEFENLLCLRVGGLVNAVGKQPLPVDEYFLGKPAMRPDSVSVRLEAVFDEGPTDRFDTFADQARRFADQIAQCGVSISGSAWQVSERSDSDPVERAVAFHIPTDGSAVAPDGVPAGKYVEVRVGVLPAGNGPGRARLSVGFVADAGAETRK